METTGMPKCHNPDGSIQATILWGCFHHGEVGIDTLFYHDTGCMVSMFEDWLAFEANANGLSAQEFFNGPR